MTSMSGTNDTQFHKKIFFADRRCLRQLQTDSTPHVYCCSMVGLFRWPGFDVEFSCKHQLNAFEMTESTNWKKGIGLENLNCNHHQRPCRPLGEPYLIPCAFGCVVIMKRPEV